MIERVKRTWGPSSKTVAKDGVGNRPVCQCKHVQHGAVTVQRSNTWQQQQQDTRTWCAYVKCVLTIPKLCSATQQYTVASTGTDKDVVHIC
jgi:hypothetical protein